MSRVKDIKFQLNGDTWPQIYVQGKRYKVSLEWRHMATELDVQKLKLQINNSHTGYNMTMLEESEGDIDEVFMWYRVISPKMIRYIYRKQKGNQTIKMHV